MPRSIPADRLASLIEAGTEVFTAQGYRRAQMQDVADALGVAKGTVYGAVAGKDALLLACVRYADGLVPLPEPQAWPLPAPAAGELVAVVGQRLGELGELDLQRIAGRTEPGPVVEEITAIVTDLMARLTRHRRAIKLVDRCAPEIDELAQLWFGAGRAQLVERLRDYLTGRAAQGLLRPYPAWDVVARTLVESCVLWAVHRHWDPAPEPFRTARPDDDVSATLAALFAAALGAERD
ncbi:TetR/AcrR family transcriptional regulator [Pseudonocardia saturnea]